MRTSGKKILSIAAVAAIMMQATALAEIIRVDNFEEMTVSGTNLRSDAGSTLNPTNWVEFKGSNGSDYVAGHNAGIVEEGHTDLWRAGAEGALVIKAFSQGRYVDTYFDTSSVGANDKLVVEFDYTCQLSQYTDTDPNTSWALLPILTDNFVHEETMPAGGDFITFAKRTDAADRATDTKSLVLNVPAADRSAFCSLNKLRFDGSGAATSTWTTFSSNGQTWQGKADGGVLYGLRDHHWKFIFDNSTKTFKLYLIATNKAGETPVIDTYDLTMPKEGVTYSFKELPNVLRLYNYGAAPQNTTSGDENYGKCRASRIVIDNFRVYTISDEVSDIKVMDKYGNAATNLIPGESYFAAVDVNTSAAKDVTLISANFTSNLLFENCIPTVKEFIADTTSGGTDILLHKFIAPTATNQVGVFVWDNLESMIPYGPAQFVQSVAVTD